MNDANMNSIWTAVHAPTNRLQSPASLASSQTSGYLSSLHNLLSLISLYHILLSCV